MNIRVFRENDWQELCRLYNRCYTFDQVSEKFFLEHLILEPNFNPDGVFVAEVDGNISGAVSAQTVTRNTSPWSDQVTRSRSKGFIMPLICFDKPTGLALLRHAEKYLADNGANICRIATSGAYLFPDAVDPDAYPLLKEVITENGYRAGASYFSMRCDLTDWRITDRVAEKIRKGRENGIEAKICELSDIPALRRFLCNSGDLTARMGNLTQKLSRNELDEVVIIRNSSDVLGYCQHNYFGTPDRVGPFCVSRECRGMGLGQIMVAKLLEVMSERKFKSAWFATCNEGNTHFYSKNGFVIFRTKYVFEKNLEQ